MYSLKEFLRDNKENATLTQSDSTTTPPAATDKQTKCAVCAP